MQPAIAACEKFSGWAISEVNEKSGGVHIVGAHDEAKLGFYGCRIAHVAQHVAVGDGKCTAQLFVTRSGYLVAEVRLHGEIMALSDRVFPSVFTNETDLMKWLESIRTGALGSIVEPLFAEARRNCRVFGQEELLWVI